MKTYMAKEKEINKKWYLIDGTDVVLGRLSVFVANLLRGKSKPTFTAHVDAGDFVIVINAEKIRLTGNKLKQKIHYHHSGYPGGIKGIRYDKLMSETPQKAVRLAVKGMLPHNRLGRRLITKLKIYRGEEHSHSSQNPEIIKINEYSKLK
ncbi:50S ribosomal protein L13 [bacterium]|nr:50S ribosomal protein L13 [bacterium]